MQRVKKIVPLTLLAFFVYAIVTSPTQAADLVHTLWDIIVQGLTGIGGFFDAVLNRK
jgi:peptidoglycan/LPS O-acetylase OafA/YrhL